MKQIVFAVFLIFLLPLSAQEEPAYGQIVKNPKTISDYFVTCPYFTYQQNSSGASFHSDFSKLEELPQFNFIPKILLLQGIPLDYRYQVKNCIVDEVNGYIHIALEQDELTMACFERTDKSRIIALRLADLSGQFVSIKWAFFEVGDGKWNRIPNDQILPPHWFQAFSPEEMKQSDEDCLSLTEVDLEIPQIGTTALLIPEAYETDLESPLMKIPVRGAARNVLLNDYNDWYRKHFQDKYLELSWNMKKGKFETGKIVGQKMIQPVGKSAKGIDDVLKNPQNIWEIFLSDPEMQVNDRNGISISFEDKDADIGRQREILVQKQQLLSGTLGDLSLDYDQSDNPLVISIPDGYINFNLIERSSVEQPDGSAPTAIVKDVSLTLSSFEKADMSKVVGYRLWSLTSKYNGPGTEYNQVAANFYLLKDGKRLSLSQESLLPMDKINNFVLKGGTKNDQVIQQAIVWDVKFQKSGSAIHIFPWHLEDQTSVKMKKLAGIFGSKENIEKAFQDFKSRWYNDHALALDWNASKGKFDAPMLVPWKYLSWK